MSLPRLCSRLRDDDRGSAAAELVVLTVVSFLFVAVIIFAGRINAGSAHTEAAARAAARTISLARDPGSAEAAAEAAARRIVNEGSPMCTEMSFAAAIGAGEVTVTIGCTVDVDKAVLVALPGTFDVNASATESIDPYREAP